MTSADPRDALFATLHETFLKPDGYSRKGRRSKTVTADGIELAAVLESSTWNSGVVVDFGINLQASHPAYGANLLMNISLRREADPPSQRWTIHQDRPSPEVFDAVLKAFASVGSPALARMSTLTGVADLCAEFGPFRFFEARSWCLRRLGRMVEAKQVIQEAIHHAPHEGARRHARHVLLQLPSA
jgi:hypothetical protein